MDLTFINMNGAMLSIIQEQTGGLQGMPQGTTDIEPNQFLHQLNRIVEQHQSREGL